MSSRAFTLNGKLHHLRGEVDGQWVCRYWLPIKRRWKYVVYDPDVMREAHPGIFGPEK